VSCQPVVRRTVGYLTVRRTDTSRRVQCSCTKPGRAIGSFSGSSRSRSRSAKSRGGYERRVWPTRTGRVTGIRSVVWRSCATLHTRGRRLMARRNRSNADSFCGRFAQERRPRRAKSTCRDQAPRGMGLDSRSRHRVGGHLRGRTRAARTEPSLGRAKSARSAVPVAGSCRLRMLWLCVLRQTGFSRRPPKVSPGGTPTIARRQRRPTDSTGGRVCHNPQVRVESTRWLCLGFRAPHSPDPRQVVEEGTRRGSEDGTIAEMRTQRDDTTRCRQPGASPTAPARCLRGWSH